MLWGHAEGKMGPIFAIIKCTSNKADLSKTRVLHNLALVPGFTEANGWKMHTWIRDWVSVSSDTSRELESWHSWLTSTRAMP